MKFHTAMGISVALHGLLAAGLAGYIGHMSGPRVLATLDLSSVDVSFAEQEAETSEAVSALPASPPAEPPRPKEEKPPEPDLGMPDDPRPPAAASVKPPEPELGSEQMDTPTSREANMAAPRQAKVDAPPKPRKAIKPDYPMGARQRGEQGDVVLEIRVNERGSVDGVAVVSSCGHAELDSAAVRAAMNASFTPARSERGPVASTARLTLTFRLMVIYFRHPFS